MFGKNAGCCYKNDYFSGALWVGLPSIEMDAEEDAVLLVACLP